MSGNVLVEDEDQINNMRSLDSVPEGLKMHGHKKGKYPYEQLLVEQLFDVYRQDN